MNLKPGDVVRLKSGGPDMTLVHVDDDEQAAVCWMIDGIFKAAECPLYCLERLR